MDVLPFEKAGFFRGRYFVLGGHLSPLDGIGPEELNMAPLMERWQERQQAMQKKGRVDERLEEIRWMLEELRVSLFAQEVKTAYPVSVKRIEKRWKELGL